MAGLLEHASPKLAIRLSRCLGRGARMTAIMRIIAALATLSLLSTVSIFGQGRNYGRSLVITQLGIAATSQTLASSAAAQILAKGGSSIDAAIAANAVLAVVEPMKTGLGGDLFVMYWEAGTGKLVGLNASGPAPKALSPEFLAKQGIKTMPQSGIHSFTVPGAVDGWAQIHKRYGKLPWKDLFQAAIAYAEQGFPVTEAIQESWAASNKRLMGNESARVFMPNGKAPKVGDVFKNPDIGHALRLIAEQGPSASVRYFSTPQYQADPRDRCDIHPALAGKLALRSRQCRLPTQPAVSLKLQTCGS